MLPWSTTSLFLREDGSILIASGEQAVEIVTTPADLLKFAIDAMRVAVRLDPSCMDAAMEALANTYILPAEPTQCPTKPN